MNFNKPDCGNLANLIQINWKNYEKMGAEVLAFSYRELREKMSTEVLVFL